MRRKIYIAGLALSFLAGSLLVGGNWISANPGGEEDPLAAVSYVDMRIEELKQLINAQSADRQVNTEAVVNEVLADIAGFFGGNMAFVPVHVYAGQTILGGEGVEIIRRSGGALAHVPGPDGLVNASAGLDLDHGHPITANHLIIIPREDGRGIRATQDSWFIIRGDFTIVTQ
ncbi:MAG: hypothetical protein LBE55_03120 [Clostridiales bacterium]|jgi:hypothetical protein|nr:hypothetical protein [Clostridiales bacterium]